MVKQGLGHVNEPCGQRETSTGLEAIRPVRLVWSDMRLMP